MERCILEFNICKCLRFFSSKIGSVGFSAVQDSSLTNTTFDFSIVNDYNDSDTCENH